MPMHARRARGFRDFFQSELQDPPEEAAPRSQSEDSRLSFDARLTYSIKRSTFIIPHPPAHGLALPFARFAPFAIKLNACTIDAK